MTPEEMLKALERAWNDAGSHPLYHQQQKDKLRREWPVLGRALDRLPPR